MRRLAAAFLLLSVAGSIAGASAQPTAPLRSQSSAGSTLRQADARVAAVGYRLALAGRPLCGTLYPLTGLIFHHLAEYLPADRPQMIARYSLDRGPGVLAI